MRFGRWASRRWIRIAMISLLFLSLVVLVIEAVSGGLVLRAVALAALAIPLLWIAKSGVEALSAMQRLARKSDEQSIEAKRLDASLVEMSGSNAEVHQAMQRHASEEAEQMVEAFRRLEVIEADRIKVASELHRSLSHLKAVDIEYTELKRELGELVEATEAHEMRIRELEPRKRERNLPLGPKPEMNLAWALGSVGDVTTTRPGQPHVVESKESGAGGSRDSNA